MSVSIHLALLVSTLHLRQHPWRLLPRRELPAYHMDSWSTTPLMGSPFISFLYNGCAYFSFSGILHNIDLYTYGYIYLMRKTGRALAGNSVTWELKQFPLHGQGVCHTHRETAEESLPVGNTIPQKTISFCPFIVTYAWTVQDETGPMIETSPI